MWLPCLLKDIGDIHALGRTDSLEDNAHWLVITSGVVQSLSIVDDRDASKVLFDLIQNGNYYCFGCKWSVFLPERWETREQDRGRTCSWRFSREKLNITATSPHSPASLCGLLVAWRSYLVGDHSLQKWSGSGGRRMEETNRILEFNGKQSSFSSPSHWVRILEPLFVGHGRSLSEWKATS